MRWYTLAVRSPVAAVIICALFSCAAPMQESTIRFQDAFHENRDQLLALESPVPRVKRVRAQPRKPRWAWPLEFVMVSSAYGFRFHPISGEYRFHSGVDLVASQGETVTAAAAGTVVFSGWNGGYGNQVEIRHDANTTTRYSHLSARFVHEGARVDSGEALGLAGATGHATGPHLHFEVVRFGEPVDPFVLIPETAPAGPLALR